MHPRPQHLNADDYYPTDKVLAQVQETFANPDIDACYGDLIYVERLNTDKVEQWV